MRSPILAIVGASLLLTACSSQSQETTAAAPLPASVMGELRNSNDYWDSRRPYHWDAASSTSSAVSVPGGSLSTSSSTSSSSRPSSSLAAPDRTWLELVGMRPDWGPTIHVYSPGWDRQPYYITYGSIMEDTYDTTVGYPHGGGSATVETDKEGNAVTPNAPAQDLDSATERDSNEGGGLRLPSGQTVGGDDDEDDDSDDEDSSSTSRSSSSSSRRGGNGKTLILPSGRVIDGISDSAIQTSSSGSGRVVTLSTGSYGTVACPEPDPRAVTAGSGVVLPGLIKGNCPVTTTILRYPEEEESVFGSMNF